MKALPLVSVIMPVYNVEDYIEDSIKSILRQTYKNFELIVVNDGSPDRSIDKAEKLLVGSKIKYRVIHQDNQGQGAARNTGLRASSGDWIIFLDSDDIISDNGIEHLVSAITQDCDLVFCDINGISSVKEAIAECQRSTPLYYQKTELQLLFLRRKRIVLAPGTLFRRKYLIDNDLFFELIPWSEDQHFIWRVLSHINSAGYLNEPIYQYLKRPGSIMSASKAEKMIESYEAIKKLTIYYKDNRQVGQYIIPRWVMGTTHAASRILTYAEWCDLWNNIEGKESFKQLLSFPSSDVRLTALLGLASPKLCYIFMKKR